MIYLGVINTQLQELEQGSLVNNSLPIKSELYHLLSSIDHTRTNPLYQVINNTILDQFFRTIDTFTFVIKDEEQISKISKELIANIKNVIITFFGDYTTKTTVQELHQSYFIDLPCPIPAFARKVIRDIATCEFGANSEINSFGGCLDKIRIEGFNQARMEELSTAIEVAAVNAQVITRSFNVKSARNNAQE